MFAEVLEHFDQDAVDVCEIVFDMTSKLSLEEENGSESVPSLEYFDEATGEMVSVPQRNGTGASEPRNSKERRAERRRQARERLRNGTALSGDVNDVCSDDGSDEEDERVQMREDERFSQPPLLRIIDSKNNLHVVTICGGVVGRQSGCDIMVEDPSLSRRLLEFVFVPESNSFVVNKLSDKGHVVLNDYELLPNDEREVEHGDVLRFGSEVLRIHVHFGNNTCPGCEQGLLMAEATPVPQSFTAPRGETARRRNLKAIKAVYGINEYAENARTRISGPDRAAKRRRLVGSEIDVNKEGAAAAADPNNIYAGCAAKPVPGTVVVSKTDPVRPLNEANKGFRLLQSMGWKEGEGLGKDSQGRQAPVEPAARNERLGLGATETKLPPPKSWKNVVLDKTRERYEKVRSFPLARAGLFVV
ncbi:unnamed protein product [Heligmosomoides polygyrus]|uniref:G-patch domain-containing protein n=1 Tax=Heligmosomoides polygyrus TaxID=6339 RepID=A0A183FYB8_HELPZ|nr:unnamed protein product [Heligmosomoides polygyrus]